MLHATALRKGNARIRRWIHWELAAMVAMVVLAFFVLLLDFVLPSTPYYAYLLRAPFVASEFGFYVFQVQIFLLLALLCAPAVICSGATLPLLFHQLRREGGGIGLATICSGGGQGDALLVEVPAA